MTEPTIVKTLDLDNGLSLILRDLSRKISKDAYCVILEASIAVDVKADVFSEDELEKTPFEQIHRCLGDQVMFAHKAERNFIMAPDKEAVFQQLVDMFSTTLLAYLHHKDFPGKLILKEYRDRCKQQILTTG